MTRRSGFTMVEMIVALTLTGLFAAALLGAIAPAERAARWHARQVVRGEAVRTTVAILTAELRYVSPVTDIHGIGADTIAMRVFRGTGVVCAVAAAGPIVRYTGLRRPEPAKDSALVIHGDGSASAARVAAVTRVASECATRGDEDLIRVELDPPPTAPAVILVFESGSYHLADRALRYRQGDSGRQPLTAEAFAGRGNRFETVGGSISSRAAGGGSVPSGATGMRAVTAILVLSADPEDAASASSRPDTIRARMALLNGRWITRRGGAP